MKIKIWKEKANVISENPVMNDIQDLMEEWILDCPENETIDDLKNISNNHELLRVFTKSFLNDTFSYPTEFVDDMKKAISRAIFIKKISKRLLRDM